METTMEQQIENVGYMCGLSGTPRTDISSWPHITDNVREAWLKGWDRGNGERSLDIKKAAALMGKKGGSSKSPKKKISSAANGKKGGRPKKVKNVE
jgi:ribosome modulation factor